LDLSGLPGWEKAEPTLVCDSFLDARAALTSRHLATLLPGFLPSEQPPDRSLQMAPTHSKRARFHFSMAWNPRLIRLNPHAAPRRDALARSISHRLQAAR
jgi:DNA-binding transcriptional LysR family regulator